MADKCPAVRLASRIVLGAELKHLQQEHGYEGGGAYLAFRKPGERRMTWPEYTLAIAGISERSAALYWQCGQAVATRLRCLGRPGSKDLHRKMEKQPSTMTAAERADMIKGIIVIGLSKGETQQQLIREYRGVHLHALETNHAKIAESGNEPPSIYWKKLRERYPDEEDFNTYTWGRKSGCDEEKARLLVIVTKELRRRRSEGWIKALQ